MESPSEQAIVSLRGVNLMQSGKLVLADVSMEVMPGEFIYLIGKTGSGKSTLLKTMYAAHTIHSGKGEVCGYSLHEMKEKDIPYLRRKLGFVFQDFQLLTDRTVYENLSFALQATGWENQDSIQQRMDDVLAEVGLSGRGGDMPYQLSGGEQQRLVVARAILNNPPIILADEPTGNLDPETTDEIMRLLIKVNREHNTAVFMATHNYAILNKYPAKIFSCKEQSVYTEKGLIL